MVLGCWTTIFFYGFKSLKLRKFFFMVLGHWTKEVFYGFRTLE